MGYCCTWPHSDAPHCVGLHWTRDRPIAEISAWQHTTLTRDRHQCLGGIRTRNPSKQAALDRVATGISNKFKTAIKKAVFVCPRHEDTERREVQLHSFLTSPLDWGE
jgi:hypothetical protein